MNLIESSRNVLLEGATPKYGCLMAMVPNDQKQDFLNVARNIVSEKDLHENGYEEEPHVTVLYGFHLDFDSNKLKRLCSEVHPIQFTIGKLSKFECPEYDVIKFDVNSSSLIDLNHDIARHYARSITASKYDYHPHLTVAYVKKGAPFNAEAAIEGLRPLIGRTLRVNSLLYSLPEKQGRVTID